MHKNLLNWALLLLTTQLCVGAVTGDSLAAQRGRSLLVQDSLNVQSFGQLQPIRISPDGRWLAYTVRKNQRSKPIDREGSARTGVPGWDTGTDIWISNIETGETRNLTENSGANWLPTWSPDGRYIAFLSDRDGSGQARLWVWDALKNDLRRASDANVRSDQLEWTPDGQKVLITTLPESLSVGDYVKRVTGEEMLGTSTHEAASSTPLVYEGRARGQHRSETPKSDPWNLDVMLRDLVLIGLGSGKAELITRGQRITKFALSPDGSKIAYTSPKVFEEPGSQQIIYDLSIVSRAATGVHVIASNIRLGFGGEFSWSPDSLQLSYRVFGAKEQSNDCYVIGVAGGTARNVTLLASHYNSPFISQRTLWDLKGEHIYFIDDGALWRARVSGGGAVKVARIPSREIVQLIPQSDNVMWTLDGGRSTIVLTRDVAGKQDGFYKVELTDGGSAKLLERGQCYTCTNLSEGEFTAVTPDSQQIAYFAEDAQHDSDLWLSDLAFRSSKRLTHLNPQFDSYKFGASRLIHWLSDDGEQLHGVLLLPSDFHEGRRYPMIVFVYGGASLSNFANHFGWYGFNLQLLATRGYAVLLPDAPQHLATPMLDLAKTVLPGVNKVIELGIADPNRLGVMGHSYGGYSTLALIVQTTRFKAAMEADGPGDLLGLYGQMDRGGASFGVGFLEQGPGLMGGTPWQYREKYIDNSPIFYLDRVETPVLIIHGSDDRAVASFLGDEVFVGLRRLGKEVVYASYPGEDHSPVYWSYANKMDFWNRIIRWFGRYLNGPAD